MRLSFPVLALLTLAGCAHTPRSSPPSLSPVAPLAGTRIDTVQLKPADLAAPALTNATLLTADSWLDDYFATVREFEELEYRSALVAHPEWAPQIEARRRVSAENENVARAAFLYISRNGGVVPWSDGDWIWNVIPCNCGKVHHIQSGGWAERFPRLTEARVELEKITNAELNNAYLLAVYDLKVTLKPKWQSAMARLKPGFYRLMLNSRE